MQSHIFQSSALPNLDIHNLVSVIFQGQETLALSSGKQVTYQIFFMSQVVGMHFMDSNNASKCSEFSAENTFVMS